MPAGLSSYARVLIVNALLRGQSFTAPTAAWLALYRSDPGDLDTGTELSGGNYVRVPITLTSPSNAGVCSNVALIVFPTATADWGTITHAAIKDAPTGGHLLFHGALDAPEVVLANDALEFRVGQIVCTLT